MGYYPNAGEGLKKMFVAQIGAIICAVLMIIPVINIFAAIAAIVFAVISLIGLYKTGQDIDGCKTAFMITIVNMVVSLLSGFIKIGAFAVILSIAKSVLSLMVVYYVCNSVAGVMNQIGASDIASIGMNVWNINLVCCIVVIVVSFLAFVPALTVIAGLTAIVCTIASLIASIMYMVFLYKSYVALGA